MHFYELITKHEIEILIKQKDYNGYECWKAHRFRDLECDSGELTYILIKDNTASFADIDDVPIIHLMNIEEDEKI